jgi:1-deoxy-D-xylulose-5-phosphate synthase
MTALPVGKGEVRRTTSRRTNRIAILSFGSMLAAALGAAEELDATVANMRFVKPLDVDPRVRAGARSRHASHDRGKRRGRRRGQRRRRSARGPWHSHPAPAAGMPDAFVDHGDPAQLLANCGLDVRGVVASVNSRFGQRARTRCAKPAA